MSRPWTTPSRARSQIEEKDYVAGLVERGIAPERIMRKYLSIREELKPHLAELFHQASTDGSPLLRALFYEFADDPRAWEIYDEYMLGPRYLVAPVLELGARERPVYLPAGTWRDTRNGNRIKGPLEMPIPAPLDAIPVFERL